jgi:hypothetical protein
MNKFSKNIMLLFSCLISFCATAQNLISPITINLPANPPANTAEWAATLPPVMILAQTRMINGQINPDVIESRILVTIKSSGSKVCGTYTPQNAPMADFSSVSKNWSGANAVNLLGQECTLKPGSYELCVQFYSFGGAVPSRILGESCKPFTIADKKDKTVYSPPSNVSPVNEKSFTEKELVAPLTFRWTPVIPRPKDPVVYRLRVWQLMQGQSGAQAMKTTTPMVDEEVTNITQFIKKITFPPNGRAQNSFVWNVEASNKNTMGGIEVLGVSEPSTFTINANPSTPPTTASCGTCTFVSSNNYMNGALILPTSTTIQASCGAQIDFVTPVFSCVGQTATLQIVDANNNIISGMFLPLANGALTIPTGYNGIYYVQYKWNYGACRDSIKFPINISCGANTNCYPWSLNTVVVVPPGAVSPLGDNSNPPANVACGSSRNANVGDSIFILGVRECTPKPILTPLQHFLKITQPNGNVSSIPINPTDPIAYGFKAICGTYNIKMYSKCGTSYCDTCSYTINVACNPPSCPTCTFTTRFLSNGTWQAPLSSTVVNNIACNQTVDINREITCNPAIINNANVTASFYDANNLTPSWANIASLNNNFFTFPPNVSGSYSLKYEWKLPNTNTICGSIIYPINITCVATCCPSIGINKINLGGHCAMKDTIKNICNKNIVSWTLKIDGVSYNNSVYPLAPQSILANTNIITSEILLVNLGSTASLEYTFTFADGSTCIVNKIFDGTNCIIQPPVCPTCTVSATFRLGNGPIITLPTNANSSPVYLRCDTSFTIIPMVNCTLATENTNIIFDAASSSVKDNFNVTYPWPSGSTANSFKIPTNWPNRIYTLQLRWKHSTIPTCIYSVDYIFRIVCPPCGATCTPTVAVASNGINTHTLNVSNNYSGSFNCNTAYNFTPNLNCTSSSSPIIPIQIKIFDASGNQVSPTWFSTFITNKGIGSLAIPAAINGMFKVKYYYGKNNIICDSFQCELNITCQSCNCNPWNAVSIATTNATGGSLNIPMKCGDTAKIDVSKPFTINPGGSCSAGCTVSYVYDVYKPDGSMLHVNAPQIVFVTTEWRDCNGYYRVVIKPTCGTQNCPPCTIYIKRECPLTCSCGAWGNVMVTENNGAFIDMRPCGSITPIYLQKLRLHQFNYNLNCAPSNAACNPSMTYQIYFENQLIPSLPPASSMQFTYGFQNCGNYKIVAKGFCGGIACLDSCVTYVTVNCPCACITTDSVSYSINGNAQKVKCMDTIRVLNTDIVNYISKQFSCSNPNVCASSGKGYFYTKDGRLLEQIDSTNFYWGSEGVVANGLCDSVFKFVFKNTCGATACDSCIVFVKVTCPPPPCNCGIWGNVRVKRVNSNSSTYHLPSTTITRRQNERLDIFIPFSCNPASSACSPQNKKYTITYFDINNVPQIITTSSAHFISNFNLQNCGRYRIDYEAKCGTNICRAFFNIIVDCCGGRKITLKDNAGADITSSTNCINAGQYTFNLSLPVPSNVPINYTLTYSDNTTFTGVYNYNLNGFPINIPPYSCNKKSFTMIFKWNGEWCSDTLRRNICDPGCCNFVKDLSTIPFFKFPLELVGAPNAQSVNFRNTFFIPNEYGTITFNKIKVQIVKIFLSSVNGSSPFTLLSNANIGKIKAEESTPIAFGTGTVVNTAVTNLGDAIWFTTPITINAINVFQFYGNIINIGLVPPNKKVNLRLRYTFYKNNGACEEEICAKEIDY